MEPNSSMFLVYLPYLVDGFPTVFSILLPLKFDANWFR